MIFFCLSKEIAQARPVLHTSLMQRMTGLLSRMLNDPATRAALSGGGEDSLEGVIGQPSNDESTENEVESSANETADSELDNSLHAADNEQAQISRYNWANKLRK